MPKPVSKAELDAVLQAVASFAEGAAVEDLAAVLPLPRRTLQRRLARLVQDGRLARRGRGRGSRYHVPPKAAPTPGNITFQGFAPDLEIYIPKISSTGQDIKQTVRRPRQARAPVSYDRNFLDRYSPNDTHYLSLETRQRLRKLGQSTDENRLAGTYARKIYSRLLIDLSWNSSRLEGNTYSLLETERLLELGEAAEGKDAREAQMILNHKTAIDLLIDQAEEVGFNRPRPRTPSKPQ